MAGALLDRFDPWPTAHALSTSDRPGAVATVAAALFPHHLTSAPAPTPRQADRAPG